MGQRLEKLLDAFSSDSIVEKAQAINAEWYVAEPYYYDGQLCVRPERGDHPCVNIRKDIDHQDGRVVPVYDMDLADLHAIENWYRIRYISEPDTLSSFCIMGAGLIGNFAAAVTLYDVHVRTDNLEALAIDPDALTQKLVAKDTMSCVRQVQDSIIVDIRDQGDKVVDQLQNGDDVVLARDLGQIDFAARVADCKRDPEVLVESYTQNAKGAIQSDMPGMLAVTGAFLIAAGYLLNRYQTRDVRAQRRIRKMNEALIEEAISAHASDTATPAPEVG